MIKDDETFKEKDIQVKCLYFKKGFWGNSIFRRHIESNKTPLVSRIQGVNPHPVISTRYIPG